MRLTALVDGLAVQFAAHDGMMNRDQLIDHVRTFAACEVGLEPGRLRAASAERSPSHRPSRHRPPTPRCATSSRSYCDAVIRNDADAFGQTWADDATWSADGPTSPAATAIVAAFEQADERASTWVVQTAPTAVFEVDEAHGTGTGRVTMQERFQRRKRRPGTLLGTYHDRYVREGGHVAVRRPAPRGHRPQLTSRPTDVDGQGRTS